MGRLSLSEYVELIVDATEQFLKDYPGYHAIFVQVQDAIPELGKIESAADRQLI